MSLQSKSDFVAEVARQAAEIADPRAQLETKARLLDTMQHAYADLRNELATERQKREEAEAEIKSLRRLLPSLIAEGKALEQARAEAAEKAKEAAMAVTAAAERDAREFRLIAENAQGGAKMRADQLAAAEKRATEADSEIGVLSLQVSGLQDAHAERCAQLEQTEAERDSLRARCEAAVAAMERLDDSLAHHADQEEITVALDELRDALGSSRLSEEPTT